MTLKRRQLLQNLLFGPGLIGLRSLVTGVPTGLLLAAAAHRPDNFARAAQSPSVRKPQYVLFATSPQGDPVNCNVPGTYDDVSIEHSDDASMVPTDIALGNIRAKGARVWGTLPPSMLAQTSFFHHGTYTVIHPDITKVLHAQGATRDGDMLPSVLSKWLAPTLGTLRREPMNFNGFDHGPITCDGILQPTLTPRSLATMLSSPGNGLSDKNLVKLRDTSIDALHSWLKKEGNQAQIGLLDSYALSRDQARSLQDKVVSQLSFIKGNDTAAQMQAAVLLFSMKVSPVVMLSFNFGSDNHGDPGLAYETSSHKASIATLATLPALLDKAGLTGQVTFCMLNVFGRTIVGDNKQGRQHNARHAVSLLIGPNVRGGVVGGIAIKGSKNAYDARAIDSATGLPNDGGDVPFNDTLASYGKTLLAASGMDNGAAELALRTGKVVSGALSA